MHYCNNKKLFRCYGLQLMDPNIIPFTKPEFDRTSSLIGRTIYIEYLYADDTVFRGYWVGPSDSYGGLLYGVIEENIFNPDERVRIDVRDCGEGYACLRTRWSEDEVDYTQTTNGTEATDDSSKNLKNTYFLQSSTSITFVSDVYPSLNDQLKWRFLCDNDTNYNNCWICDKYYSIDYPEDGNCLYASYDLSLHSDWLSDHPSSWFGWRIVVPRAEDEGFIHADVTICNDSEELVEFELSNCRGVTITEASSWHFTESISRELHEGIKIDLVTVGGSFTHSAEWGVELGHSETFSEETCSTITFTVSPHKLVALSQLTGKYGPYTVKGTSYKVTEMECTKDVIWS